MREAWEVFEVVELTEGQGEGHLHLIRGIVLETPSRNNVKPVGGWRNVGKRWEWNISIRLLSDYYQTLIVVLNMCLVDV